MPAYAYRGDHPDAVAADAAVTAQDLKDWAATVRRPGTDLVPLIDLPGLLTAALRLPDAAIDGPAAWASGAFRLPASALDITAWAAGPAACYGLLTAHLFRLFPGRGAAYFPVTGGGRPFVASAAPDLADATGPSVRTFQVAPEFAGPQGVRTLAVTVTAGQGAARFWAEEG